MFRSDFEHSKSGFDNFKITSKHALCIEKPGSYPMKPSFHRLFGITSLLHLESNLLDTNIVGR